MYNKAVIEDAEKWMSISEATKIFGYADRVSLRNRVRQLRSRGDVTDLGNPPAAYRRRRGQAPGKVMLYWLNPKIALLRRDAPKDLFVPRRGKRRAVSPR